MIVADEFVEEEFEEPEEENLMNPSTTSIYDRPVNPDNGEPINLNQWGEMDAIFLHS